MRKPWTTRPDTPWWVSAFTDIGRPLMSVVVLVLCAPGEQHLARMAGWTPALAWGMAGLLAAYAGIAAVVATVRPSGAPGKRNAAVGAVLALLLAMAAQPVSHLFVTGWLSDTPRAPVWLIVTVSTVPPLVLGHLLHLAAGHPDNRTDAGTKGRDGVIEGSAVQEFVSRASAPESVVQESAVRKSGGRSVSVPDPKVVLEKSPVSPIVRDNVRPIRRSSGVTSTVRELVSAGHGDEVIPGLVAEIHPDAKPDSVRRIVYRIRNAQRVSVAD